MHPFGFCAARGGNYEEQISPVGVEELKSQFIDGGGKMRRILAAVALTVTISVVASGQTNDSQTTRDQSERELIALSREFVDTSVGAVGVEMGEVKMTPHGPMSTAVVKDQWKPADLEDTKVHFEGDKAVVTGRVIFRGESPKGKEIVFSSGVKLHFIRQKDGWKFVSGCIGNCDGAVAPRS